MVRGIRGIFDFERGPEPAVQFRSIPQPVGKYSCTGLVQHLASIFHRLLTDRWFRGFPEIGGLIGFRACQWGRVAGLGAGFRLPDRVSFILKGLVRGVSVNAAK